MDHPYFPGEAQIDVAPSFPPAGIESGGFCTAIQRQGASRRQGL